MKRARKYFFDQLNLYYLERKINHYTLALDDYEQFLAYKAHWEENQIIYIFQVKFESVLDPSIENYKQLGQILSEELNQMEDLQSRVNLYFKVIKIITRDMETMREQLDRAAD